MDLLRASRLFRGSIHVRSRLLFGRASRSKDRLDLCDQIRLDFRFHMGRSAQSRLESSSCGCCHRPNQDRD